MFFSQCGLKMESDKNVGSLILFSIQIMNLVWKGFVLHILIFSCQSLTVPPAHTLF